MLQIAADALETLA